MFCLYKYLPGILAMLNICCRIARLRNCSRSKMQNCFSFFVCLFLSFLLCFLSKTLFCNNSVMISWEDNGQPKTFRLLGSRETSDRKSCTLNTTRKRTEGAPATFFQLFVILVSDRWNTGKYCKHMHSLLSLHRLSLSLSPV